MLQEYCASTVVFIGIFSKVWFNEHGPASTRLLQANVKSCTTTQTIGAEYRLSRVFFAQCTICS